MLRKIRPSFDCLPCGLFHVRVLIFFTEPELSKGGIPRDIAKYPKVSPPSKLAAIIEMDEQIHNNETRRENDVVFDVLFHGVDWVTTWR